MNQPINLTLLLLTHNEEHKVGELDKWLNQCPNITEIIVVDDRSTDNTIKKIKELSQKNLKIKIFSRGLEGDFASQRNFGVSQSSNGWILWLDPDETPGKGMIAFLKKFHPHSPLQNYYFTRHDIFLGQALNHGEAAHQKCLRLFNKHHGIFVGKVHEVWKSDSPAGDTGHRIIHRSHSDLAGFWHKINFYSSIRAEELYRQYQKSGLIPIIIYPFGKFIVDYFFRPSLLDGTKGIIFSLTMSFYSFLVRAKLWHLYRQKY